MEDQLLLFSPVLFRSLYFFLSTRAYISPTNHIATPQIKMAIDTHNDVSAVHEEEEFTFTPASIPASLTATFTPSFGSLANSVRRSSRGLRNRLHSIARDAAFVERVRAAYGVPVVTNARAGDWYVDPERRQGGVYFKSTDGHVGEWMFSLRRLNLGLVEVLEGAGGRG